PNTQGFSALQILNMIEDYDIKSWGDGSFEYYHHLAEAVKIAFADRDAWLSDPKFTDIPLDQFLSKEYAKARRQLISADKAREMSAVEPGIPAKGAKFEMHGGDTCYFWAVDSDGLVVSAIQSIYHDFGSAVVGGDTGIIMQNRGSAFSLDEEHP